MKAGVVKPFILKKKKKKSSKKDKNLFSALLSNPNNKGS
jgi:hypothetical protein